MSRTLSGNLLTHSPLFVVASSPSSSSSVSKEHAENDIFAPLSSNEISDKSDPIIFERVFSESDLPRMWSKNYIGLYAQYAAVGLLYGSSGTFLPFCSYVYKGPSNLCANSSNIVFFAWNFKIFFAILTDCYRPFGLRRKPWMIFGWTFVLVFLAVLAFTAHILTADTWLTALLLIQLFLMFSDVPADGYSVELGQLEPPERRGRILATGQTIRFSCCVVAGLIQTFLLNGPSTNVTDCPISASSCWDWGLTINQYYGLLFALVLICFIPICYLHEPDATHIPYHTLQSFIHEVWYTMRSLTTFYLIFYVIGIGSLTNFVNNVNIFLQYYIIDLTNLEAGIDTITTYSALAFAIYLFQTYLINQNWRHTQYASTAFANILGLLWILAYYNIGGTRNPWFTIFIDLDQSFASGISQVLFSLSVIELARPGQEATTYELLITVYNAANTLSGIIATQLLSPLKTSGCIEEPCPSNSVDITSVEGYESTDGPWRFTNYTLVLLSLSLSACVFFTPFLPSNKEQCHEWQRRGQISGGSTTRGYIVLCLSLLTIMYGVVVACLLLNSSTSCLEIVGGTGCS